MILVSYADDVTILASNTVVANMYEPLNEYLETLNNWFKARGLSLSPTKSTATLFTTTTTEMNTPLNISINDTQIPSVKCPKILGVVFDNLLTFGKHAAATCERVQNRNNVLKALAGTKWGLAKETLATTFKVIGRTIINYAAPVWTPNLSATHWAKLQRAQNAALRTVTGCHRITSPAHLHAETKMLPVREHSELLAKQFLAQCMEEDHPNHAIVSRPNPARRMKHTLMTKYGEQVAELYDLWPCLKSTMGELHTISVREALDNLGPNPVLRVLAPPVDDAEKELPRSARTTLAQLRSGFSQHLQSYLSRIGAVEESVCPLCKIYEHTSTHLFNCPARPTELQPEDLWADPKAAAAFLGLLAAPD
jgi:hypothetical protein